MTNKTSLLTIALMASLFTGCSKQTPMESASPNPKVAQLGVVEVSDGKTSRHDLGNGRICTITPTVLPGGMVALEMVIEESGKKLVLPMVSTMAGRALQSSVDGIGVQLTPQIKP
jgi:hypothetical protein